MKNSKRRRTSLMRHLRRKQPLYVKLALLPAGVRWRRNKSVWEGVR